MAQANGCAARETALLQVHMDKKLKTDAEGVFAAMGINATTAVKMFFAQAVNCNGLPFQPTAGDPLYSEANLARLRKSILQMERGKGKEHDLEGI